MTQKYWSLINSKKRTITICNLTPLDYLKYVRENDSLLINQKEEINLKDDVYNTLDAKITIEEIVN